MKAESERYPICSTVGAGAVDRNDGPPSGTPLRYLNGARRGLVLYDIRRRMDSPVTFPLRAVNYLSLPLRPRKKPDDKVYTYSYAEMDDARNTSYTYTPLSYSSYCTKKAPLDYGDGGATMSPWSLYHAIAISTVSMSMLQIISLMSIRISIHQ